jgi:hypothetical protein
VLFTRALAQIDSAKPGRIKRKYIGSKIIVAHLLKAEPTSILAFPC